MMNWRKQNKTMNTIYNDSNLDVRRLKVMVEELGVTEKSFKTDVTAIVTTVFEDSKSYGPIAIILIFSMELDAYLTKNSSSWYKRCMLIKTLILLLSKKQIVVNIYFIYFYYFVNCYSVN